LVPYGKKGVKRVFLPHPLFTLKNRGFFREPEFHMVTSPPVSPSPIKERGKIKRGAFAPLGLPFISSGIEISETTQ